MRVEYLDVESRASFRIWRYQITAENGMRWEIAIVQNNDIFLWTVDSDSELLAKHRHMPCDSLTEALTAATNTIEKLELEIG